MAQRWNRNALHPRSIKDGGAGGRRDRHAIDGELDLAVAHTTRSSRIGQTPSGQRFS